MTVDYYKSEINALNKEHWPEIAEWLEGAVLDSDIDVYEIQELNDIADKIYYSK